MMNKFLQLIVILITAIFVSSISAQTSPATNQIEATPVGNAISVAPARFEAEMEPGSSTTFVVHLNYRSDAREQKPSRVAVSLNDWNLTNDGQVVFSKAGASPNSASSWIVYSPSDATVTPGQNNTIRVTISVPKDAAPGDHLSALIIEPRPDNSKLSRNERQVTVRYRMATMIYVKVPKLTRKGSLENLKASTDQKGLIIVPTLKNEGNSVVRPIHSVKVLDVKGQVVAELPEAESLPVLAKGELSKAVVIEKKLAPGTYTVKYKVDFQDGGKATEGVKELIVN
jgi:P pilus assembly chaperone PapD